jgi:hypothetical protein
MNKDHAMESSLAKVAATVPHTIDWKEVATRRLGHLVRVEHDFAVMRERFERLRSEHDALLLVNDRRLMRLQLLQTSIERSDQLAIDFAARYASMEASRSWRITAPLRKLSTKGRLTKRTLLSALLASARSTRLGSMFARISPTLHARIRARL